MLYKSIEVKGKEYKCRLSAHSCVELEKKLKCNPLNIIASMGVDNKIPELETLLLIFHASLQKFQHNITLEDVYDIYDEYCDEGKTIIEFIQDIVEIFKISGFFKEQEEEKN